MSRIDLHVHIHSQNETTVLDLLRQTLVKLNLIQEQEKLMSVELDALTVQVAANTSVEDSALTLIKGFAAQLAAAIAVGNPAALTTLHDSLKASADALAAAVAANTPPAA